MKFKCILILSWILGTVLVTGCKKGGSAPEENLVVVTTPAALGQLEAPAPGPNFPLNVTIQSAMPSKGITISISAKVEGGTATFFTTSLSTTSTTNDFSITGTPRGVVNLVEITVTSNSTATNRWTGSYKYSMK